MRCRVCGHLRIKDAIETGARLGSLGGTQVWAPARHAGPLRFCPFRTCGGAMRDERMRPTRLSVAGASPMRWKTLRFLVPQTR
ncbi:hypothetical protein NPIL_273261 [Nephila pilipes]|uniref:Uncharacterized protein n=1 Tax=Nephila pilipes TaxID=299642 RepID=A0A8X6NIU7_NEPPI|nr:hypothetical protein NPIL_273261 [Nephila pilipes]